MQVSTCIIGGIILLLFYYCFNCRLYYDGQDDLLFNLDNRNLFFYGFLLEYLHLMVEGRNPLAAYMRASSRSHASQSHTKSTSIATLRAAWNAFSRLLDINFHTSFLCLVCGAQPSTMICDGTMLGFRKDLISCVYHHTPTLNNLLVLHYRIGFY